jgi:hypothetical protein
VDDTDIWQLDHWEKIMINSVLFFVLAAAFVVSMILLKTVWYPTRSPEADLTVAAFRMLINNDASDTRSFGTE